MGLNHHSYALESSTERDSMRPPRTTKRRKRSKETRIWSREQNHYIKNPDFGGLKVASSSGGRRTHLPRPCDLRGGKMFIPNNPECRTGEIESFRAVMGARLRHALHSGVNEVTRKIFKKRSARFLRTTEEAMLADAARDWLVEKDKDKIGASSRLLRFDDKEIGRRLAEILTELDSKRVDCPPPTGRVEIPDGSLWHFVSGGPEKKRVVFVVGDGRAIEAFNATLAEEDKPFFAIRHTARRKNARRLAENKEIRLEMQEKYGKFTPEDWRRVMNPSTHP